MWYPGNCTYWRRPKLAGEVQQLLEEASAAGCQEDLGRCQVLSPVRPSRKTQVALGAGEQVCAKTGSHLNCQVLMEQTASFEQAVGETYRHCVSGMGSR